MLANQFTKSIKSYGSQYEVNILESRTGYDPILDSPDDVSTETYSQHFVMGVLAYEKDFFFDVSMGIYVEKREMRLYCPIESKSVVKDLATKSGYVQINGVVYSPVKGS